MNEKYLQDLYGWIKGQDPSYEGRYTYDQFKQRMQDETYATQMHGWISSKDETFSQRRPLTSFVQQVKVVSPMAVQPKKKEDTTALPSGVGSSASSALTPDPEALRFAELVKKQGEVVGKRRDEPGYIDPRKTLGMYPTKEQADKATAQAMADISVSTGMAPEYEEKDFFEGGFGSALRELDKYSPIPFGEIIDDTARTLAAGFAAGQVASAGNELNLSGPIPDDETIEKLIEYGKMSQDLGPSDAFIDFQKKSEEVGGGVWGFFRGVTTNPAVLPELVVNSLTAMATNKEAVIAGAGTVLTNAIATAAAAGAPTLGTGAAPGFVAGAASAIPAAMGIASGILTTGATFSELLVQELGTDESGNPIEPTVENVRAVLEDPEKLSKIRNKSIIKGATVGAIDFFTGKLASSVGAKILSKSAATSATGESTKAAYTKSLLAGAPIESAGGGIGEGLGTAFAGEKQSIENILFEMVAEVPMSAISTAQASLAVPVYKVNNKRVSAQQLDEIINTMEPADLAVAKIDIENDYEGRKKLIQDKIVTGEIANQVREAQPDLNDATVNAIVDLQKQLNTLEGNKTQVAKDRAALLRARIKELQENQIVETKPIQEDAIQEQAAGQVPVQPGTGVSQEVAQGEPQAEPQGVTQEGQAQEGKLTQEIKRTLPEQTNLTDKEKQVLNNLNSTENISLDEAEEIFKGYKVNDYSKFNNLLRKGLPITKENLIKEGVKNEELATLLEEDYNNLSRVLSNSTFSPKEQTTLYRVMFDGKNILDEYNEGDIISDKSFASTTIDENWVKDTNRPMIKFELEKGDQINGFYAGGVEKEFIINKDTEFVVKKKEVIDGNTVLTVSLPKPQAQEEIVTPQQIEKQRSDLDMEVKALEDLLDDPNQEPLFKKSDNDTKFGESADVVEDVVRQINELPSGNVTTTITPKPQKPINIDDLESRADVPVKRTTFDVIKGIPAVFSISDQLRIGNVTNPNTGNVIDRLFGGLGFGFTKEHENFGWANTTEDEGSGIVNKAVSVYNNNKALFDDWWAKNPEYNGLVPLNIVKMAEGSIMSNEALYRVLKDNFASFPKKNKVDALNYLVKNRIPSVIDSKNKSLSKPDITPNSIKSAEKVIKSLNTIQDKIKSKKIKSIDQLLEPEFYIELSLPVRAELISQLTTGSPNKAGEQKSSGLPGENTVPRALLGVDQEASLSAKTIGKENLNKVSLSNATDIITEPAMRDVEPRQIIAIYGVDVLNPKVKETKHPNYKFGINGRPIGVLENSVSIQEAYPFAYTNILESLIAKEVKTGEKLKAAPINSLINEKIPVGIGLPNLEFIGAISQGVMSNAQKLSAWINKSFPSVIMSTDAETFANVLNSEGVRVQLKGDEVVYGVTVDGDIYINPDVHNSDSALFNTTIHEFGHIWLNFLETTAEGKRLLNRGVDLVKKTGEYQDQLKKFNGNQTKAANEALAILIGNRGETIVNASLKSKFQEWLLGMWKYVKDKFKLSSDLTPQEIQDLTLDQFLGTAIADLFSGKALPVGDIQLKKLKNPEAAFSKSDSIDSIVQRGRANGFSEESIKIVLQKRGFTQEAIDAALGKVETAAKKVEVTEEFAPGYDRVLNNIFGEEGVVAKSRKRGVSKEGILENAINYLRGTKVYENATEIQRDAMERNVNKELGKREKAAPSAEKIIGKPKRKQVTVEEMAALKDQIKLEARAAREAKGDLNTKRKALAARIIAARRKGTITAVQARALVNRISKVNLDNPIMVDRLLEYTDKVFDDANYASEMDEIRKLQKQAKSRNHTSMTSLVNEFASINPEDIPLVDKETGEPLNKIMEYKEALDFLNTRTPFYGKMNEVFDEMVKYKKVEKFDAVKTKEALQEKYKSIALNKVKNVEEYVNLIKDINSIKRKLYQLLENGVISPEEYDIQTTIIGEDQAKVENKYASQISKIKKDLITEIKNQRPKPNPNFTKEQNDLIKEYLQLNDSDIENLSPEDLFILNDLLENISNGEIDYYRLSDIVSKAAGKQEGVAVGKQLKGSKVSLGSAKLREEMAKFESSFWEGLLGLGRATSGPLQKFIISPFNRAIGSYEKFNRDGFNEFLKLKKKYKIDRFDPLNKSKDMHKIGMLTTYLQEYMAQFDPKNKNVKDIGKRDWFKQILDSETMRDDYSPEELKTIEEIYKTLPKDKDGNVDPKAVYDSYEANDGKFFTKNQKAFFDSIMEWKKQNSTGKQKAANEMSGNAFKEIPFHMLRSRYGSMSSQITPTVSGDNGMVRINAGTGKERVSEAVGAINTNFEKLFIKGLEQTGRDFFLTKALKDINNVLASAKKELDGDKEPLLKAISYTLSDALSYEFSNTASQNILKRLVQARAAMTLLDPIRTGIEFTSTLLSFGLRARTLSGYKNLFGSQGDMKNLLEFTDSPLRLRQNINNAIDINDGKIEKQSMLTKWTTFLSGLPERTMMVTSWMPTFTSEFQRITGEKFDMKKFNDSESYREKYGKAIKEASAVADAQTEKIIGPTTKAGQRREIIIFPGKTVGRDTVSGQILGFFSNYPFRESTEFINGFREAGEVLKKDDSLGAISQLQKPLGIALNVAAYGFLSSVAYASRLILLGDDDEEERGTKLLEELMTAKGFIEETAANAAALAASKYAGGGRAILQVLGTLGMALTDDEETKATIKKMLKGSVYVDPLPTQKLTGYGTADKVNTAIIKYIPQFVVLSNTIIDAIGGANEVKAIYDKVESKGIDALTKDEELKVLALSVMFTATQLFLNYRGTSLPSYNNLKAGMKTIKEESGVADIADGKVPSKKSSGGGGGSRGGGMNKTDLKRYNRELYDQLYGEGSATYEIEQEVKAFEKEQREYKKKIKDQVYGD